MSVLAAMRAAGLGPSCCVVGEEEAAPSGRGPTPALHSPVFSLPPRGGRWTVESASASQAFFAPGSEQVVDLHLQKQDPGHRVGALGSPAAVLPWPGGEGGARNLRPPPRPLPAPCSETTGTPLPPPTLSGCSALCGAWRARILGVGHLRCHLGQPTLPF